MLTSSGSQSICRRCIMDTSDPFIEFRADGTCCYCDVFDKRMSQEVFQGDAGKRRLLNLVEDMKDKGKKREYDCLIGVSGGVDSTMAVWILRQYGLRVLAIHLDNGWDSELAVDNIKKVLDRLGVQLFTHVLDWEEFRDLQLAFLRASVPNCEVPTDHAIVALHFNVARKFGLQFIINGSNVTTEAFVPKAWSYDARDLRHLRAIHREFGSAKLRTFPTIGVMSSLYSVFLKGIRWIPILNYIDYDKTQALELLQRELDWRPYSGKHHESIYTRFYQGYILPTKFGFNKKRAHLSSLVLAGQMSREKALTEVANEQYIGSSLWREDREYVLKKLRLSEKEFDGIMKQQAKTHYEYSTNRLLFESMPGLFRVFKKIATST